MPNASLPARPTRTSNVTARRISSLRPHKNAVAPPSQRSFPGSEHGLITGPENPATSRAGSGSGPWNKGPARNRRHPPTAGPARHADLDPDIESREFLAADEEPLGQPGPAASQADAREGKRRRRRRGRRRERERPELEAAAPAGEEFPSDFDDLGPEPGYVPSFPRRLPEERLASDEVDELDLDIEDLEDVDDAEDMAIDEEDVIVDDLRAEPARVVEEEIDPELEQEIRKEIEEIEELEREMGLRGPAEATARPRR